MRGRLLFSILLAFVMLPAWAQQRTISGRVTAAEDGAAIPGVSVSVLGTTRGVSTDNGGNYSIGVNGTETLVFSSVGYGRQEVQVGDRSRIDVTLVISASDLDEVVVIGYGAIEKRNLTGAQTSIAGQKLAQLPTPSFDQQLSGRAAGVQVTVPNGLLGQSPRIRIRGTNTISSGAEPLVVIDNVPVASNPFGGVGPANPLGDINPADIESIEILKDGAATAIFGSRAANGVILVTTKRGKVQGGGAFNVNYNGYMGFNEATNRLSLLNAAQFVQIANEKLTNAGQPVQAVASTDGADTDWQDMILRRGAIQSHNLSLSGATERTNYLFSLGYLDNQGPVVANSQRRYTVRANLDQTLNKWLTLGTSISFSNSMFSNLNTGGNSLSGNVAGAARLLPNVSPYLPTTDPNYARFGGYNITPDGSALGQGQNLRTIDNNFTNIAFVLANNKYRTNNNRLIGNAYAEAQVLRGLRLRSQIAADLLMQDDFQSLDPRHGDGRGINGYVYQLYRPVTLWNWQNTLSYVTTFNEVHNINAVVGAEYQKRTSKYFSGAGQGVSELFFIQQNLISGSYSTQLSDGSFIQDAFDSYFGRINYNYAGRYFLSFSLRNDGLSSLPMANRRGTFPGGSVAWRISQEPFMKSITALSDLRLRASYAVVGNTNIGFFPYLGTFGAAQYGDQTGIAFGNTGNPDLKWEQSKKTNFGLDFGLLNSRVSGSVDYFVNQVDNLVLFAPTAASLGVPGNGINRNIGALENRGIELALRARVLQSKRFSWDIDANFTSLQNKITALNNNADVLFTYHINRVGLPIGSFYGYRWAGVNAANGNPMWYKGDGKGNMTGDIVQYNIANGTFRKYIAADPGNVAEGSELNSTNDRFVLGNSNPTWLGGITNTFRFGGFDFEVFGRFSGGNKVMNVTRQETLLNMGFQNNGTEILQRWTTPGQVTNVPRLWTGRESIVNSTGFADSRFLEDGSFFRIQNIVLGYTVPGAWLNQVRLRSARVYAQVQNPFIFTRYTGLDPELSASTGNSTFGIDQGVSPIIRTVSFGLSLGL